MSPKTALIELTKEVRFELGEIALKHHSFPTKEGFSRTLNNWKNSSLGVPKPPKNYGDILEELPEDLTKTKDGQRFMIMDEQIEDKKRIFGMSSPTLLAEASEAEELMFDGNYEMLYRYNDVGIP